MRLYNADMFSGMVELRLRAQCACDGGGRYVHTGRRLKRLPCAFCQKRSVVVGSVARTSSVAGGGVLCTPLPVRPYLFRPHNRTRAYIHTRANTLLILAPRLAVIVGPAIAFLHTPQARWRHAPHAFR